MELLTEQGYVGTGLDQILKTAGVPKGSFYHYFKSKDDFGHAIIEAYGDYFVAKLDHAFTDQNLPPLDRLRNFIADARKGMTRHSFKRGCLVGNLSQELSGTEEQFRTQLETVFSIWEKRVADLFKEAQATGDVPANANVKALASFFWIGWEGAILRSRLVRSAAPLNVFEKTFFAHLTNLQGQTAKPALKKGKSR
ncbi:MAG: TetR/AcrR family transcriptional regulator [Pseudomonadota bacterium]